MKSGLYRIEVQMNALNTPAADRTNLPEADSCAIITDNDGVTFAKLHPVRIVAKPKKKDPRPCNRCIGRKATKLTVMPEPGKIEVHEVNYCAQCGRRLDE